MDTSFSTSADPEAFVCVCGASPASSLPKAGGPRSFAYRIRPPIDLHSFTPPHLHTTRSGPSGDPDRAFLMSLLVAYPNPQAQPGEGENGHYEFRDQIEKTVRLYKPSGAEIAYISPAKMRLRWTSI
ncbi:hypothetical protein DPEC_G00217810 [Dallia pectoralis]|uniref:Uncharacterized protein n=1 Tax=Dallia pectoralis TaxID=75939 RepID=A0ACC2G399_DALPE|nr:hypothetical protein DPEC_G00217810 [Dallia pectoralis]